MRIAAYRDPECEWTLQDLFEKAAHPERIFAAVSWQYSPHEDPASVRLHGFRDHVRTLPVPAALSRGVCWARHGLERLWRGEEYTLQIDSHSRFASSWDRLLLAELAACATEKPVLSSSPAAYTPPHCLSSDSRATIRVARGFSGGSLRFRGASLERAPERPLNGAFVAAGFVFSSSRVLEEVPYDPELYFNQEESAYALRLYTHGWDVFSPSRTVLYHYYNAPGRERDSVRPLHWQDNLDWRSYDALARARYDALTAHQSSHGVALDLGAYGLGSARSLGDYEAYAGVDFARKLVSERALRGLFIADLARYTAGPARALGGASGSSEPAPSSGPPDATRHDLLELSERDCLPFLSFSDQHGRRCQLQHRGGQWTLMLLAAEPDEPFWSALRLCRQHLAAHPELGLVTVVGQAAPSLSSVDVGELRLWCDAERHLCQLLGAETGHAQGALVVLVNPNLRIERVLRRGSLLERVCEACNLFRAARRPSKPRVIDTQAPVLLIPNVLSPEDCRRLIEYYQSHPQTEGKVGVAPSVYRPSSKLRTDCYVQGSTETYIDEHLARRVFPELEKVYGLVATHREGYKLGCYDSADRGFFSRHRDNLEPELAYRRYAVLLNLNAGFAGGELCFPEYGNVAYRPATGHAIAFACSLVHEARPVTQGQRYILQGFVFGEREAQLRARLEGDVASVERSRIRAPRISLGLAEADATAH